YADQFAGFLPLPSLDWPQYTEQSGRYLVGDERYRSEWDVYRFEGNKYIREVIKAIWSLTPSESPWRWEEYKVHAASKGRLPELLEREIRWLDYEVCKLKIKTDEALKAFRRLAVVFLINGSYRVSGRRNGGSREMLSVDDLSGLLAEFTTSSLYRPHGTVYEEVTIRAPLNGSDIQEPTQGAPTEPLAPNAAKPAECADAPAEKKKRSGGPKKTYHDAERLVRSACEFFTYSKLNAMTPAQRRDAVNQKVPAKEGKSRLPKPTRLNELINEWMAEKARHITL
ncbi:MAG: hypothetical protein HQL37_11730, partial [Alphaproteobacteria bacterium]|nr:hypothetical protein [Alphaproteobacteria bacterium]